MKTIQLLLFLTLGNLGVATAQTNHYEAAMEKAIEQLQEAQTPEALQAAGNAFERIAQKETGEWLPHYYAAFARISQMMRMQDAPAQDKLLDAALDHVKAAKELSSKNSELLTLEGLVHMMRIPLDPATRGPQYSGLSMSALQQAVALAPDNPRAHLILGEMQFGTAQFFGQGSAEACASFGRAIALFEETKPESKLYPAWGLEWAKASKKEKDCSP